MTQPDNKPQHNRLSVILLIISFIILAVAAVLLWQAKNSNEIVDNDDTDTVENSAVDNNTETDSDEASTDEVTFKDQVLTDPVAGYSITLPDFIQDVRVVTSSGPKITHGGTYGKTLRYVEMTGSDQDYGAIIKLGVAKNDATFSIKWLEAGNVENNISNGDKTDPSMLSLNGTKVAKTLYKADGDEIIGDRIIYTTYSASNDDFTLAASLFNPGFMGKGLVDAFDQAIMSITFTE